MSRLLGDGDGRVFLFTLRAVAASPVAATRAGAGAGAKVLNGSLWRKVLQTAQSLFSRLHPGLSSLSRFRSSVHTTSLSLTATQHLPEFGPQARSPVLLGSLTQPVPCP